MIKLIIIKTEIKMNTDASVVEVARNSESDSSKGSKPAEDFASESEV